MRRDCIFHDAVLSPAPRTSPARAQLFITMMQFAMELGGDTKRKITMADAVRKASSVSGVGDIIGRHFSCTEERQTKYSEVFRESLKSSSIDAGFELNDIQTRAVSKLVHMDSCSLTVGVGNVNTPSRFQTPLSDIRRPSILDLPTGTGKTITSVLGGILFAIERDAEMGVTPRMQDECAMGCIAVPSSSRESNRTCLFFVAKHLLGHWLHEAGVAKKIVANMRPDWKVSIHSNEDTLDVEVGEKEIAVVIGDNSHGPKKVMLDDEFYSSVCFDESGEYSSNALSQRYVIKCGRFMLVSADVSSWNKLKPRRGSILLNLFPCWEDPLCYGSPSMTTAACLSMAAVFKASDRQMVLRGSGSALEEIDLYTATIKYVPSLLERLGHGAAVDLGDISGVQMFESKYDISIAGCKTLGDIVKAIEDRIKELKTKHAFSYSHETVLDRIKQISTEECPVCLDTMEEASVLQPCLHFTCSGCVNKIGRKCPM